MKSLLRVRYHRYKCSAKVRELDFDLDFRQFYFLATSNCAYCGDKGYGVDRIDSNEGYYKDNVVPSCKPCNKMKMDLPVEEFLEQCKKVVRYLEGL